MTSHRSLTDDEDFESFENFLILKGFVSKSSKEDNCPGALEEKECIENQPLVQSVLPETAGRNKKGLYECGKRPHKYDSCDESFVQMVQLVIHPRIYAREKTFKCNICGKAYQSKNGVTYHQRTHTGEKTYKCDFCGKAFSRNNVLQEHIRNHTGEKPFKCGICDKAFATSAYLKRHLQTHKQEKPFKCHNCGRDFTQKQHLEVHLCSPYFTTPQKGDTIFAGQHSHEQ